MTMEEKVKELEKELKKLNEYRSSIISAIDDLQKDIVLSRFKGKYFKITTKFDDIYYTIVSDTGKFFEFIFYSGKSYSFGFDFKEVEYIGSTIYSCKEENVIELSKEEYTKDLFKTIDKYIDLIKQKANEKIS